MAVQEEFVLPPEVAHHVLRVMRMQQGDVLVLFDGQGGEHHVRLQHIRQGQVTVAREAFVPRETESPLQLWLGQSLCASEKMDWVFQKAVELGVNRCSPLQSERSVVRLGGDRAERRQGHWQRVVEAACEQSGRNRIPRVDPVQPMRDWLVDLPAGGLKLILSPQGQAALNQLEPPAGPVILLVGPEGGFGEGEEAAAAAAGFLPLRLGPRVLRTETAALALLSALQARWGDFVERNLHHPL